MTENTAKPEDLTFAFGSIEQYFLNTPFFTTTKDADRAVRLVELKRNLREVSFDENHLELLNAYIAVETELLFGSNNFVFRRHREDLEKARQLLLEYIELRHLLTFKFKDEVPGSFLLQRYASLPDQGHELALILEREHGIHVSGLPEKDDLFEEIFQQQYEMMEAVTQNAPIQPWEFDEGSNFYDTYRNHLDMLHRELNFGVPYDAERAERIVNAAAARQVEIKKAFEEKQAGIERENAYTDAEMFAYSGELEKVHQELNKAWELSSQSEVPFDLAREEEILAIAASYDSGGSYR